MSLTFGFYNSINGDRVYDAIQMGQIFDGIITDGIYATYLKAMVVKASDNASEVIVQPGRAWFNHTWTYIDADYPVEAPAPEVILDRVDTLVLDINAEYSDRENKIIWVQGTPSSVNPEAPSLTNTTTHHQYPLCDVYRKAGTTMIYAADITNRVGTSDTPFVTGVLTGINIDDLLSQWDDEFHTWENATKTSFEGWMLNQQSVYTTWFESIRTQMSDDLTSFEEWFETIRGIIDEEAATHLQAEIDELKDMLPAGSHIDISTNESTLFNRNVTVSDGVHSKTVQFNAVGGATVESFPYIGSISVTSTDGERTAQETINIPYFGRYSVVLAFWSATVNLVGDSAVGGVPVTVKDSDDLTITTIVLDASGSGTFTATKPDTYKFIYTYGGQTMETTLQVTQETTYEVEIHGGFNYQAWLTAGRVSETFSSLDDILADEETLRQLMLVHDAVDYLANANVNSDVEKIFNTDLAAKWINNSDYALDTFYAVADIKTVMDTADKYGYGEWTLMPQVPTMTSNTAPFGEVIFNGTGYGEFYPYFAFDGNDTESSRWACAGVTFGQACYIGYHFTSPIKLAAIKIKFISGITSSTCQVQGSNDGTNWTNIGEPTNVSPLNDNLIPIVSPQTYEYYRVYITNQTQTTTKTYAGQIQTLQFYAYAPKGNVPVMTADTAPYGEASATSSYGSGYEAFRAFDANDSTQWVSSGSDVTNGRLQYKFVNPICPKKVTFKARYLSTLRVKTFSVLGSNDGTNWETIREVETLPNTSTEDYTRDLDCETYYLYLALGSLTSYGADIEVKTLQFYGRSLSVSVPTMTSNTAPYGEASASSENTGAFNAFTDASGSLWTTDTNGHNGSYIGYEFTNPTIILQAIVTNRSDTATTQSIKECKLQYYDGNDWQDASDIVTLPQGGTGVVNANNIHNVKRWRILGISNYGDSRMALSRLQFYGLDYSEKEFEVGTTKKWLYDHGVELETLGVSSQGGQIVTKNADSFIVGSNSGAGFVLDLTPYSLARLQVGREVIESIYSAFMITPSLASYTADAQTRITDMPYNTGLDVSSFNTSKCVMVWTTTDNKAEVTELWLE